MVIFEAEKKMFHRCTVVYLQRRGFYGMRQGPLKMATASRLKRYVLYFSCISVFSNASMYMNVVAYEAEMVSPFVLTGHVVDISIAFLKNLSETGRCKKWKIEARDECLTGYLIKHIDFSEELLCHLCSESTNLPLTMNL